MDDADEKAQRAASRAEQAEQAARDQAKRAEQAEESAEAAEESAEDAAEQAQEAIELVAPPEDPVLDTGVRRIEAQVDEENPWGRPGERISRNHPFVIGFLAALGVAAAAALVEAVLVARQVLVLILVSAFLAVGLDPAVRWLVRQGLRRSIAVFIITVAALGFFGGFVAAVAPPIATQSTQLVKKAPDYVKKFDNNSTFQRLDRRYHIVSNLEKRAKKGVSVDALGGVFGVSKAILGIVASTLTVVILTIYFLANMPGIKRVLYRAVPRTRRARVGLLTDEILDRVGGYVLGNLATSLVAGTATFIWLIAWRVPYPVALAMFVAITDLIPLVGATIGAIGVTAVALFHGVPVGIATFAFYMAYQQFENYVLQPRIMKKAIDVAPVVTIVAALLGAAMLGILGALIAVPIAAGVQLIMTEVLFPRQDET
ncbi:MAG TPA: AI-2E family transporter [Mycobacteriales bacterium]|nr:AI-2E family transporter [Mycobacteriales bacterium]